MLELSQKGDYTQYSGSRKGSDFRSEGEESNVNNLYSQIANCVS